MSIETESLDVLAQLLTFDGAFAGASYFLLELLESDYRSWNEDGTHDESLSRIRGFVHQACERYPAEGEDSARERCAGFLAEEETEPA